MIAAALTLIVLAGVFTAIAPAHGAFAVQPELADVQQRVRVAALLLERELRLAGAGPVGGAAADDRLLARILPAILPYRLGPDAPDAAGTFRPDTVTVISSPPAATWTTIRQAIAFAATTIDLDAAAGCPTAAGVRDPACGLAAGALTIVTDDSGAFDFFTVTAVAGALVTLQHTRGALTHTYPAGSRIAAVRTPTLYLKDDPVTGTYQLMRYNGAASDAPVADHIVRLEFEYYGTAPGGAAGELRLTPAELTDGPWLPDAANVNRYDADLQRVRRVSVRVRGEAAPSALRGPAGILFAHAGSSTDARRRVADLETVIDVAPPNLGVPQ